MVLGFLLGLLVAVLRMLKPGVGSQPVRAVKFVLRWLMNAYVAFIRGTPLLVQVLLIVYGLPQIKMNVIFGQKLSKFDMCVIALVINSGAYMAEIIRAGLQSVDKGQAEAADSLGMNSWTKMVHIILPQAVKTILPTMGNEFVAIIKESSVLYAVGVYELTYQANKLASVNYRYIETFICSALIYFVLTYAATSLLKLLERRMRRGDNSIA